MDTDNYEFKGTIVSWYPFPIEQIQKPGLMPEFFAVNAGDLKKKVPGITHFNSVRRRQYINDDQGWSETLVPASQLCSAIIYDYFKSCIATEAEIGPGMFWVPNIVTLPVLTTDKQYKDTLDRSYNLQLKWFEHLVKLADDTWSVAKQHRSITTIQKYAAEFMNLDREWLIAQEIEKTMSRCPSCNTMVPVNGIKCASCGYILDLEKYAKVKERFA
jgi:hypothetical protein